MSAGISVNEDHSTAQLIHDPFEHATFVTSSFNASPALGTNAMLIPAIMVTATMTENTSIEVLVLLHDNPVASISIAGEWQNLDGPKYFDAHVSMVLLGCVILIIIISIVFAVTIYLEFSVVS